MKDLIESINTDKNKALFEYEMTEVLLQLKGEFATFSGKGTKFAESNVDDQKLIVNVTPIPNAVISVTAPEIPDVPEGSVYLDIQVPTVEFETPPPRIPVIGVCPSFKVDAALSTLSDEQNALVKMASRSNFSVTLPKPLVSACTVEVPFVPIKDNFPGIFDFAPEFVMSSIQPFNLPKCTTLSPLPEVCISAEKGISQISLKTDLSSLTARTFDSVFVKYHAPDIPRLPASISVDFAPSLGFVSVKQDVPQVGEMKFVNGITIPCGKKTEIRPLKIPDVSFHVPAGIEPVVIESIPVVRIPKIEKIRLGSWSF